MKTAKSGVRLSKYLSEQGLCSRREADALISKGEVFVNAQPAQLGQRVSNSDHIEISKKANRELRKKVSIAIYKPVGYVSAQAEKDYKPAITLVTKERRDSSDKSKKWSLSMREGLAPVGRLDIDSKGLLILSQDGVVAKQIIGPDSQVEKEYIVKVRGDLTEERIKKLRCGLSLDGKALRPTQTEVIGDHLLKMILTQGKKRQIRRMCELVQLEVLMLKRVRIGNIEIGALKEGQWRLLTQEELEGLKNISSSRTTQKQ